MTYEIDSEQVYCCEVSHIEDDSCGFRVNWRSCNLPWCDETAPLCTHSSPTHAHHIHVH